MKYWERMLNIYKDSDIDFKLDKYESAEDVDSKEFGKALKSDANKIFDDEVTEEKLDDLLWGASSFPMQPLDGKLESFQAWLGGFIEKAKKGDGTIGSALKIAHEEMDEAMANREDN